MDIVKKILIIKVTAKETNVFGGMGVCDICNTTAKNGYLIAVLNFWCCRECTFKWLEGAKNHIEDREIEEKTYDYYFELLYYNN